MEHKLSPSVVNAIRTFSYFIASGTHFNLVGVKYFDLYGDEPSAIEQMYAIFANNLRLDADGNVTNLRHSELRATEYLKSYCLNNYVVNPPFEDWEVHLP